MSAFLLLITCPLLGGLAARLRLMPDQSFAVINAWVLRIAFPALVLEQVPRLVWEPALVFAAAAPWVVIGGALILIPLIGRRLGFDRVTIGALVMTCGFGNTAFIGLPMIGALAGPETVGPALIADQLGSFIAVSTVGMVAASMFAGDRIEPRDAVMRVLRSPPFIALVVALCVRAAGGWPQDVAIVLHRLGDTLTPMALFSVGLQFRLGAWQGRKGPLAVGLAWKLVLAPLAVVALAAACGVGGPPAVAGILQAAQGPMITSGIMAQEHRLAPELVTLVTGVGIAMSFATAPLWYLLVR
ncbi:MAG: AEC family transporter [Panacagrimonas sp.]